MNQCKLNKNTLKYVRTKESHRANIFLSMVPTCKEAGFVLSLYALHINITMVIIYYYHGKRIISPW